jgi:acyl-coenzyme A synthetase/AMP-(fatty) acid ligase
VAFVALRAATPTSVDELHRRCVDALARYTRPRAIFVLDELPKNAVGKISKQARRDVLGTMPQSSTR